MIGGLKLKYPLRNLILKKIRETNTLTDSDLMNNLEKEGIQVTESDVNKILLDLEIFGLIRVNWVSKDKRRIEIVSMSREDLV